MSLVARGPRRAAEGRSSHVSSLDEGVRMICLSLAQTVV